tara:strand:+ start:1401 stop:2342 length:942 start_codon:yes stop_codon:yes gene_type:complete
VKKKILICGATGFIGRNLLEHFMHKDEYDIRAVWNNTINDDWVKDEVEWVRADLTKKEDVKKVMSGIDIVLNYAAFTTNIKDGIEKPYLFVTDNVIMNSLILRYAYEFGVEHVILPSCTVMYEDFGKPIKETDFKGFIDDDKMYFGGGSTKVYSENMCKFYSKLGKTKYTVLRQTNIIGKYDKTDLDKAHFFSSIVQKVNDADKYIEVWGDGTEEKDLLSVNDLVNLIEIIIKKRRNSKFELLNVASGDNMSISNIVKNIVEASGKNLDIRYDVTKPSRNIKTKFNISKVKNKYGWKPKMNLKEILDEIKKYK